MGLMTTTIMGIELDVYYGYESERDPYGTGDSPTAHYVEILSVEATDSTVNIQELLSDWMLEQIEQDIIDEEA